MTVLIATRDPHLQGEWCTELRQNLGTVVCCSSEHEAWQRVLAEDVTCAIVDIEDASLGALALADFIAFRHPHAPILPIIRGEKLTDASVLTTLPNAGLHLRPEMTPGEVAAAVEYCLPTPPQAMAKRA